MKKTDKDNIEELDEVGLDFQENDEYGELEFEDLEEEETLGEPDNTDSEDPTDEEQEAEELDETEPNSEETEEIDLEDLTETEEESDFGLEDLDAEESLNDIDLEDDEELIDEEDQTESGVVEKEEDDFSKINMDAVKAIEHETKSAVGSNKEASDIRIINTNKSGRRIVLNPIVIEKLDLDDTVQMGILGDALVVTKDGISAISYNLKKQNNTFVIYNTGLIKEITKSLQLHFANCSTVGLSEVKYGSKDGKKMLLARK